MSTALDQAFIEYRKFLKSHLSTYYLLLLNVYHSKDERNENSKQEAELRGFRSKKFKNNPMISFNNNNNIKFKFFTKYIGIISY